MVAFVMKHADNILKGELLNQVLSFGRVIINYQLRIPFLLMHFVCHPQVSPHPFQLSYPRSSPTTSSMISFRRKATSLDQQL